MKKPMQTKVKLLYPYKNHSHLDFFVLALIFSEVSEDVCNYGYNLRIQILCHCRVTDWPLIELHRLTLSLTNHKNKQVV